MTGKIQGFYKNRRDLSTTKLDVWACEGYMLDELQVDVTIKSKDDIDKLIDMLRYSENCFYRHDKKE